MVVNPKIRDSNWLTFTLTVVNFNYCGWWPKAMFQSSKDFISDSVKNRLRQIKAIWLSDTRGYWWLQPKGIVAGSSQEQQLTQCSCTTFPQYCEGIERMSHSIKNRLRDGERDDGSNPILFPGRCIWPASWGECTPIWYVHEKPTNWELVVSFPKNEIQLVDKFFLRTCPAQV